MYGKDMRRAGLRARLAGLFVTTVRSCSEEFGPPPAVEFGPELASFTDAELLGYDQQVLLAACRRVRAVRTARGAGRGWDPIEATIAWRDDLLALAARMTDPEYAADLREQAAELTVELSAVTR